MLRCTAMEKSGRTSWSFGRCVAFRSPGWGEPSSRVPITRPWYRRGATTRRSSRAGRSEEHTSELQSLAYLVCRLLLEKKKDISAGYKTGTKIIGELNRRVT